MLLKVLSDSILQRCDVCGSERELPHGSLLAGVVFGDPPIPRDPNILVLPSCPGCGAKEFLNRVAATDPTETSETADHRRGVNALHAALVAAGRAAPSLRDWFAGEAIYTDKAEIPWSFSGTPPALPTPPDPGMVAFARYASSRYGGE